MKKWNVALVALLPLLFLECRSETGGPIVPPPPELNLLTNGSFEIDGVPSLRGWNVTNDPYVNHANDAPAGGGSYSAKLKNVWVTPGTIWQNVVPPSGTHQDRLSAWAKVIKPEIYFASGHIIIAMRSEGANTTPRFLRYNMGARRVARHRHGEFD